MPVNFFFDNYQNRIEQALIEDLTIEAIKIYGVDVIYMPRDSISRDDIFGEDIVTKFKDNYMIEMYLETVDGFGGDGDFLAKFGMQIKDTATFVVSRRRFEETIFGKVRPMEGDLLFFPLTNTIFEINFVEHENPFYQIGKLHSYKLTCELFTFSHEDFETGRTDIDRITTDNEPDVLVAMGDADTIDIEKADVLDPNATRTVATSDNPLFDETNPFGDL